MSAQLQQAIINAHNAGDVAAAQRLGQMLKKERQASQVAPQAANPSGVAPHRRNQATQPKAKDGAFEGYGDAFMRGIDQPLENMGVTAEALGAKGLGESLKGAVDERPGQSASGQFMNADKDGTFAYRYLPKAAVEQAGQFAGSLLARAGGAAVGGAVGNVPGAIAGGLAGPMMFEFAQQLGPIALERAKNNGRETPNKEDWTYATGTSAGVGALNAIAPGATGKIKRMFIEGVTEGTQSVGEQVGSTVKTDKGLEVDPRQALAEGIIGGTSAGMVDTSISTAKAATNLVRGNSKNIKNEGDVEAAASFADRLNTIATANSYDLKDIDKMSTKGARETLDKAHVQYTEELKQKFADLKSRVKVTAQDSLTVVADKIMTTAAYREGRNKTKNTVGNQEMAALEKLAGDTREGQEAMSILRQLNQLTEVHNNGYQGGVSQVTDQFAPFGAASGYDKGAVATERLLRPLVSGSAAISTGGGSLLAQAAAQGTGRLIDKVTGKRSKVATYVKNNSGNQGIPGSNATSLRETNIANMEAEEAAAEEARLRQEQMAQEDREASLESAQKNDPANPESPQGIFELGTALDRNGIAQILRIMKRNPSTLPATLRMIDAYETSVATGGQVDFALIRKINGFVDSNSVYKGLMGNRARNQGVVDQASQQQLSQKEQNYQRGIDNNRAEAARITEAVNQDKTIEVQHKAHLLSTLEEMQLDLGLNPVGRLQTMQKRLEEKGVPGPTVEKYLGQYLQRVMAQQGAKEERDAAQDDAMEIDESREPLVSLADKSQAALDAWNKNSGDSSLRKAYLKARRERDDAGEFGEELTTEYRMQHQAPVSEDDASMHDLEKAMPDFYKRSGDYRTGSKLDWATLDILRRVKDDPEQQVKVYRAVPINASNTINYGDWVTVNKQYAEDHGEGMPEGFKVIEGAAAAKDLKTNGDSIHEFGYAARQGKIVPIYHSTNEDFEEFDTKKSADGTIWFSDNLSLVEGGYDGASGNALVVTRYIDESKLALASRSQEDKLMHQQLQSMGYDGVKYADSKDNVYQIYDPSKLQSNEVNLSVVPGPGALTQPESPQIPFDFTAPSVGQIKDKLEDAKGAVQMVIGKPGTKFENGLSSMEDFKQLADMLNVSVGIFNSQKEFMEKYSVTKGTRGLYGSNKGGVSGQIAILANGIESDLLYTTAHESAHPLESRPASNEEAELLFGRKVSGRHPKSENVKRNVYANSLRAKLRGKYGSDPVIQAEIDKLQDGTVIFIANRPDLPGRPARLNLGQTYEMFRDENPQGSKGQALLDAQNSFPAYQGYMKGDGEFAVDPVMFYLINPKAMKKDMPNTFKFMQKHFNESNIPIKIYASPLATIMAILMAGIIGGEEEEENPGILTPEPGMLTA